MVDHEMDRRIERIARRQHGVFSAAQASSVGATRHKVASRRRRGQWLQLAPSVFALPSHPPSWPRQMMAAQLSLAGSGISGLAAAHLRELDGCRPARAELTVARGSSRRSPLAIVHQSDRFQASPLGPFMVATVAQTLCDCAARLGPRLGEVLEAAVVDGRVSTEVVLARCESMLPRPPAGVIDLARLATALGDLPAVPTSVLEVPLYRILSDPRIPPWEAQATPAWWPADDERLDAYIPTWSLIVEADGRTWHTRRADFDRDRRRDHIALANGHRTVRFTHGQLVEEPQYVLRVLLSIGASTLPLAS